MIESFKRLQSFQQSNSILSCRFIWCYVIAQIKERTLNCRWFSFLNFREEKGIPVDGLPAASSAQATSAANMSGALAGATAATARQNTTNPLNNTPYSQRYHTLYRKRITLPVFEYRADFMRLLAENRCIVLVGEVSHWVYSKFFFFC